MVRKATFAPVTTLDAEGKVGHHLQAVPTIYLGEDPPVVTPPAPPLREWQPSRYDPDGTPVLGFC